MKMHFAPVIEDDDELSQLIRNDTITHDNNWQLEDDLDGESLASFWEDALRDLGAEAQEE